MKGVFRRASVCVMVILIMFSFCAGAARETSSFYSKAIAEAESGFSKVADGERYYLKSMNDVGSEPYFINVEAFNKARSNEAQYIACQIPDERIKNMSTNDLLISCIWNPLAGRHVYADSIFSGYTFCEKIFNGLRALRERPDAAETVYRYYLSLDLHDAQVSSLKPESLVSLYMLISLSGIVMNDFVLDQLSQEELKILLEKAYENLLWIETNGIKKSGYWNDETLMLTVLLSERVIPDFVSLLVPDGQKEGTVELEAFLTEGEKGLIEGYLDTGSDEGRQNIARLFAIVRNELYPNRAGLHAILPDGIIPLLSDGNGGPISIVKTPRGSDIITYYNTSMDASNQSVAEARDIINRNQYLNAQFVQSPDCRYNCHSYAWYSQPDYKYRWMAEASVPAY